MKGGEKPIHIQRWAPADLWSDEHWKVLVARRDYRTMTFYRTFLDMAYVGGGDLPADPEALAAAVSMPRRDVEHAVTFCLGRLIFQEGDRLYQRRVRREVAAELEYRRDQAIRGAAGGKAGGKGRRKADVRQASNPPSPLPTPTPLPTTRADAGAAPRAGGADSNSREPSNGGPPARPQGGGFVLDHDPTNLLEARVASKVAHLASLTAAREGDADPLELLKAVSATEKGVALDHVRGAPERWLEETSRACDRFEEENFGGDEPQGGTP